MNEKLRFQLLSSPIIGKCLIRRDLDHLLSFKSGRWQQADALGNEIQRQFENFLTKEELNNSALKKKLTIDIIQCYYIYGTVPLEYFLFRFRQCNRKRRGEFLSNRHKDTVMTEKVGRGEDFELLENKWKFYQKFSKFFHRDVFLFTSNTDKQQLSDFVSKHNDFICKPLKGQCGRGIEVLHLSSFDSIDRLFEYLHNANSDIMIEELIHQSDSMKYWNESSVNTIRLPMFHNPAGGGYKILKPCLRMGRKDAVVDNAASGGIVAVIDEKTGVILTDGCDELGHFYKEHPDSHHPIKGWQVPNWKELIDFATEVHSTIDYYPYIGWDFALTDNGWCLIEGNWGQFLSEFVDYEGIRKRFDDMFV